MSTTLFIFYHLISYSDDAGKLKFGQKNSYKLHTAVSHFEQKEILKIAVSFFLENTKTTYFQENLPVRCEEFRFSPSKWLLVLKLA